MKCVPVRNFTESCFCSKRGRIGDFYLFQMKCVQSAHAGERDKHHEKQIGVGEKLYDQSTAGMQFVRLLKPRRSLMIRDLTF